jgi:hypothetical protein
LGEVRAGGHRQFLLIQPNGWAVETWRDLLSDVCRPRSS